MYNEGDARSILIHNTYPLCTMKVMLDLYTYLTYKNYYDSDLSIGGLMWYLSIGGLMWCCPMSLELPASRDNSCGHTYPQPCPLNVDATAMATAGAGCGRGQVAGLPGGRGAEGGGVAGRGAGGAVEAAVVEAGHATPTALHQRGEQGRAVAMTTSAVAGMDWGGGGKGVYVAPGEGVWHERGCGMRGCVACERGCGVRGVSTALAVTDYLI